MVREAAAKARSAPPQAMVPQAAVLIAIDGDFGELAYGRKIDDRIAIMPEVL